MAETTTIARPAPYLEAAGQTYLDLLTKRTGQAPTAAELQAMSPQISGQNVFTQQAQQQAASQAGLGALTFDPTTGAVTGAGQGTGIGRLSTFSTTSSTIFRTTGVSTIYVSLSTRCYINYSF